MGRWAQARRRASAGAAGELLFPPAAPVLTCDGWNLAVVSNEPLNVGSFTQLLYSADEGGPYLLEDTLVTNSPTQFAGNGGYDGSWFVARELGNGLQFSGSSPDSNEIHYVL